MPSQAPSPESGERAKILERLQKQGLISKEEFRRERQGATAAEVADEEPSRAGTVKGKLWNIGGLLFGSVILGYFLIARPSGFIGAAVVFLFVIGVAIYNLTHKNY